METPTTVAEERYNRVKTGEAAPEFIPERQGMLDNIKKEIDATLETDVTPELYILRIPLDANKMMTVK